MNLAKRELFGLLVVLLFPLFVSQINGQSGTCINPIPINDSQISQGSFTLIQQDFEIDFCEGESFASHSLVFKIPEGTFFEEYTISNRNVDLVYVQCCEAGMECGGPISEPFGEVSERLETAVCSNETNGFIVAFGFQQESFSLSYRRLTATAGCDFETCSKGLNCTVARPLRCGQVENFGTHIVMGITLI